LQTEARAASLRTAMRRMGCRCSPPLGGWRTSDEGWGAPLETLL